MRLSILLAAALSLSPLIAQDVDGRVVDDATGNALPAAELKLRLPGTRELAADLETDRSGIFKASGLAPGEYSVEISKPNFITTTLKLHLPTRNLRFRLVRYAVISGQVVDTEGQPLPGRVLAPGGRQTGGTRIAVLTKQPGSDVLQSVRQVMVGDGGKFRVFDLPPGQYIVGVWWSGTPAGSGAQLYPDNAHPRSFTISGSEDYRDVNFTVVSGPSFTIKGKIEGPRPKMEFSIALGSPDFPTLPITSVWSEDDGTFTIDKVSPGTYDVFVAGPTGGYGMFGTAMGKDPVFGRNRIQVSSQMDNLNVPVSPGRTAEIKLRGPSDTPPKGCPQSAAVFLSLIEPWWVGVNSTGQGGFAKAASLKDLPPARYSVTLNGLGTGCYQVSRPVLDLTAAPGELAVIVDEAGAIHGTLRAGDAKPKDFAVLLLDYDSAPGVPAQLAFPDEQGRFAFDALRPGRYRIAAQPAAAASAARWITDVTKMVEVDVVGGAPTTLELPVAVPKGGGQ